MVWLGQRNQRAWPVPFQPPSVRADAHALLRAERVGQPALDGPLEHERPGDVLDRQLAVSPEVLIVDRLDALELVGELGVLLDVEEVCRAKVGVPLIAPRLEAGDLDLDLAAGLGVVAVGALEKALELVETSAHRGYGKVVGGESKVCMRLIDLVL